MGIAGQDAGRLGLAKGSLVLELLQSAHVVLYHHHNRRRPRAGGLRARPWAQIQRCILHFCVSGKSIHSISTLCEYFLYMCIFFHMGMYAYILAHTRNVVCVSVWMLRYVGVCIYEFLQVCFTAFVQECVCMRVVCVGFGQACVCSVCVVCVGVFVYMCMCVGLCWITC